MTIHMTVLLLELVELDFVLHLAWLMVDLKQLVSQNCFPQDHTLLLPR